MSHRTLNTTNSETNTRIEAKDHPEIGVDVDTESASTRTETRACDREHTCPECVTDEPLVTNDEETYCEACGLVTTRDLLDRNRRWVDTKDGGREPQRGGAPTTIRRHDKGLPTEIGHYRDGYSNQLPARTRRRFNRLRKWDDRSKTSSTHDRSLRTGLGEVARLVSALELPKSIHNRAASVYREAWKADLLQGRSIEAVASASVFAACRLERLPRYIEEIASVAVIDDAAIKNAYKLLNRELQLATPPPLPRDFLPRLASAVDAHPCLERRARQLVTAPAVGSIANSRQPSGVAAACLYHAYKESEQSNVKLTQARLATEGNTTPTTIRKIWRELLTLDDDGELPDPVGNTEDD
ncbi:transcription initiation factor IIB [Haloglomus halophilum]|uniref:transcription initiation factor IIB n=1 Tax=Haloglomus halophilum TaxID=2962672 RepID=UPI00331368E8